MKQNRNLLIAFLLLIITGALYRLVPGRPLGFAPQLAMAVFGGAVIRDRKWAFALPVCSLFLSDALFEGLTRAGIVHNMPGFYDGQWVNYLLIAGITFIGMLIRRISIVRVAVASLAAPVVYFLLSNFAVWISSGGYGLPLTASGLYQCYVYGLPFLQGSLAATCCFGALLFGGYSLIQRSYGSRMQQALA